MKKFGKKLFWDVSLKDIDYHKHRRFIIERVLNFGDLFDYKLLRKIYGFKKIKESAKLVNFHNKKTLYFWSLIFNIPLSSFLCFKKLSIPGQSIY